MDEEKKICYSKSLKTLDIFVKIAIMCAVVAMTLFIVALLFIDDASSYTPLVVIVMIGTAVLIILIRLLKRKFSSA